MDALELYAATLGEVKRQAAQLGAADEAGGDASGCSASDSSGGWVVLESGSTPAQLPGAAGCSLWPQQQWQIAYEILVSRGKRSSFGRVLTRCYTSCRAALPQCSRCVVPLLDCRSFASARQRWRSCGRSRMTCSSLSTLMRQRLPPAPACLCGAGRHEQPPCRRTCSLRQRAVQAVARAAAAAAGAASRAAARRHKWTGGPRSC